MVESEELAGPPKHLVILLFDDSCKLIGYEFRKADGSTVFEAGSVKRRWQLATVAGVGGNNVGAAKEPVTPPHPGAPDDVVDERVRNRPDLGRKRIHMTFAVEPNDPCCECGKDIICY